MKYIKYFEGFTDERLKDLISNGETYVDKISRSRNNIMTDKNSSNESINLWHSILKDDEVYSGTNNKFSIIIKKDIDDVKLKSILDKIGKFTLIYDDDLNTKINEIYG